jgi:hypothetical protein
MKCPTPMKFPPLWVKDRVTGDITVFPVHMIRMFPDGKFGFEYDLVMGDGADNKYWQLFKKYKRYFIIEGKSMSDYRAILVVPTD